MDVALILDRIVPAADYFGSLTADTEAAFDAITWNDGTTKPTWAEMVTEEAVCDAECLWSDTRATRTPLMATALEVLDKHRNQLEQTGGATDIDAAKNTEWADYLQELRDVTIDFATPDLVVWPTKPA